MTQQSWFNRFAKSTAHAAGHPGTFVVALGIIAVWALTGPLFGFNDTWQLVINTGTTIITFLMVFVIQNSQNRDGAAVQIKLDELIRAVEGAHNVLLDLEELEDADLERMRKQYLEVAAEARKRLQNGLKDIDCPECKEETNGERTSKAQAALDPAG